MPNSKVLSLAYISVLQLCFGYAWINLLLLDEFFSVAHAALQEEQKVSNDPSDFIPLITRDIFSI